MAKDAALCKLISIIKRPFLLGPVDLSSLFLQQFVGYLYKNELMSCGYSTPISEDAVEMVNKSCPSGSTLYILLFVVQGLLRILGYTSLAAIKSAVLSKI